MHVILGSGNKVALLKPGETSFDLGDVTWAQTATAGFDEPLLMITNFYRFLLVTPRQLEELADLEMSLSALHHFREYEEITLVTNWSELTPHEHMTIVTSRGFARAYKMEQLKERIENPAPYQFDHQLNGVPIAALGTNKGKEEIIIANSHGRCLRLPTLERRLYLRGLQAIHWNEKAGERVMSAIKQPVGSKAELILITAEGYGKRLNLQDLPIAKDAGTKPAVVASRKPTQQVALYQENLHLVTNKQLILLDNEKLPPADNTSKTYKLQKLQTKAERLCSVLITN